MASVYSTHSGARTTNEQLTQQHGGAAETNAQDKEKVMNQEVAQAVAQVKGINERFARVDPLIEEAIKGGDFVEQVCLSDQLLDAVGRLEAETHDEEMALTQSDAGRKLGKYALSSREWQALDWFFYGVLARRGAFELTPERFGKVAKALGKEVIAELQSVIDSRTDAAEETLDDLAEAAAEPDAKIAFVLYVEAVNRYSDLDGIKDFTERVMGELRDVIFDQQQWAKDWDGVEVPENVNYATALVVLKAVQA
jgi:hypothetical protein